MIVVIKAFTLSVMIHICDSVTRQVQAGETSVKSQPVPQEAQCQGGRVWDAAQVESLCNTCDILGASTSKSQ